MTIKPYAAYKIVVGGSSGGDQTWSFGVWCTAAESAPTAAMMNIWAASLLAATNTLITNLETNMGEDTAWNVLKTYYYPPGEAAASVVGEAAPSSPLTGSVSSPQSPYQVALVATLLTGLSGSTNKGRIYLPLNAPVLTDRQLVAGNALAFANIVRTWLIAINSTDINTTPVDVIVAGHAAAHPVNQVRVDSRLDIQRRRTDKIVALETSSTASF